MKTPNLTICTTDTENYEKLSKRAGVPRGSNILVYYDRIPGYEDYGKSVFRPYIFTPKTLCLTNQYDNSKIELFLDGELDISDVPNEIAVIHVGNVMVIVPLS